MALDDVQLLDRLGQLGVPSRTVAHPPLFTVEESRRLRGDLPGGHTKNLFLSDKRRAPWLVVALEDTPVDLKAMAKTLGAGRFSFASAERLEALLGVRPGSVTPFALANDLERQVTVVLEARMLDVDPLNFHPLRNDRTTAIAPAGLLRFIDSCGHQPRIVDLRQEPAVP